MIPRKVPLGAVFSLDRRYRYLLWRWWEPAKPWCMVIGLNPSTADETTDDPTIRRCIRFAEREGCGGLLMTNIYALRSTDPKLLRISKSPIGPKNDDYLMEAAKHASVVIAAWGADQMAGDRGREVADLLAGAGIDIGCLGKTKSGAPKHPLYLRKDTPLEVWP